MKKMKIKQGSYEEKTYNKIVEDIKNLIEMVKVNELTSSGFEYFISTNFKAQEFPTYSLTNFKLFYTSKCFKIVDSLEIFYYLEDYGNVHLCKIYLELQLNRLLEFAIQCLNEDEYLKLKLYLENYLFNFFDSLVS